MASRTRPRPTDDDEVEIPSSDNSNPPSPASDSTAESVSVPGSSASKRRRLNNDAEPAMSVPSQVQTTRPPRKQHRPGMIVRVDLKNFITYSKVTFKIGPSLNMIIGPNGTGKSSLVCGICLGLGWGPNQLGRAKDPGEFVKYGHDAAEIKIELKGHDDGEPNPVVRRVIHRETNKSSWWINDKPVNQKKVMDFSKSFNIQIDNLCQFLPQDRVVEFSQMSPVDKLISTLQAAAKPEVSEWHKALKELREEEKTQEKKQFDMRETLKSLETRQAAQEQDVQRMRERQTVQQDLELLEQTTVIAEFNEAVQMHDGAKIVKAELKQEMEALERETRPARRAVDAKKAYFHEVTKVFQERETFAKMQNRRVNEGKNDREKMEDGLKDCENKRKAEATQETKRSADRLRRKNLIEELKILKNRPPPDFDVAAMNEQARAKARDVREIDTQLVDLRDSRSTIATQIEDRRGRITNGNRQLDTMNSQAGQQASKLDRLSKDTAKAWEWIQANRDGFEGPIFGPPLVECSIKKPECTDQIESMLQQGDFKVITCTTDADFKALSRELNDKMGLRDISIRNVRGQTLQNREYQPPVNDDMKAELGINTWALECIEGPEPILVMLSGERLLHATAVFSSDISDEHFERLSKSPLSSWVTPTSSFRTVKRAEYGPSAVSTTTRQIQKAKFWTNQPVDTQRATRLREDLGVWNNEIVELEEELTKMRDRIKELETRKTQFEKEEKEIREDKEQKQKAMAEYQRIDRRIDEETQSIAASHTTSLQSRKTLQDISKQEIELNLRRGEAAIKYARALDDAREAYTNTLLAHIAMIEAESDLRALSERNQHVLSTLTTRRDAYKAHLDEVKRLRAAAERLLASYERLPSAVRDYHTSLPEAEQNRTPAELAAELDARRARLLMLSGSGDASLLRDFDARARKIEGVRTALAALDETTSSLATRLTALRTQFEPALDTLVARISAAFSRSFERIGCAGAVDVHKAGPDGRDFAEWAMRISVKFRENEPLSVLDAQRQSGGERAVSTVFYLMALQAMARAPFRVVDEINQGMDPRNERVVHERLVDVATGNDTEGVEDDEEGDGQGSQYFLVTPKLLPGLKYVPGMVVHCIVAGDKIDGPDKLDLGVLLAERVRRRREGAAVVAATT